ncbi:MAG: hypothetical protein FWC40_01345 [Proteobacteria bacterium]|nr:hypothetical protein [Pseudomonadota bacterium]
MFTRNQIIAAGFLGPFAGCFALTVNLGRLPYPRGQNIGIVFGILTQLMATLIVLILAILIAQYHHEISFRGPYSHIAVLTWLILERSICAWCCRAMANFFEAPHGKNAFQPEHLLQRLKKIDTGKTSVVHDVVTCLEKPPRPQYLKPGTSWIIMAGFAGFSASVTWLWILIQAIIDLLTAYAPINAAWATTVLLKFGVVILALAACHIAMLILLKMKPIKGPAISG